MDTNVISDFAASEFSATVDPALAFAPRYALIRDILELLA
jgi:hypothetical protein